MTLLRPVLNELARLAARATAAVLVTFLLAGVAAVSGIAAPFVGGWLLFLYWVGECFLAARRGKYLLWGFLVCGPLGLVTFAWVLSGYPAAEDPFGFVWATMELFIGIALVTAATGNVLLLSSPLPQTAPSLRERT